MTIAYRFTEKQRRNAKEAARRSNEWNAFPAGKWEDMIVIGSFRRNRDGSITVRCQIDVSGDGHSWGVDSKSIRLRKKGEMRCSQKPTDQPPKN